MFGGEKYKPKYAYSYENNIKISHQVSKIFLQNPLIFKFCLSLKTFRFLIFKQG